MFHSMTTLFCLKTSVTRVHLSYFYFCTQDTKFHKILGLGNEYLIWRQIALEPHKTEWRKTKGWIIENQRASGRSRAQDASGGRETLWKWEAQTPALVTNRTIVMRLQMVEWRDGGTRRENMKAACTGGLESLERVVIWACVWALSMRE